MAKRSKRKLLYAYKSQRGKTNKRLDRKRKALKPGKRRSSRGKVYYERRKNRSDLKKRI